MNKVKIVFCLFLLGLSTIYIINKNNNINVKDLVFNNNHKIEILKEFTDIEGEKIIKLLDINNKEIIKIEKEIKETKKIENKTSKDPEIYIFNTHQTEEYKESENSVTPTVLTASKILKEKLKELGISSYVEEKDIIKEVKKRGYDYTGTYTVSFEYLQERKKEYPSLNYYFDVHRDSITGENARTTINNKNYATLMFLVGANYDGYEKNLNNLKIMEKYLEKKYPGLIRNTYIQRKSSFNQEYSENMFLVEIGGPDNTLEEVANTTKALGEAIKYYMEEKNEK